MHNMCHAGYGMSVLVYGVLIAIALYIPLYIGLQNGVVLAMRVNVHTDWYVSMA